MGKSEEYKNQCALFNAMSEVEKKAYNKGYKWAWECSQNLNARIIKDWQDFEIVNESKIEGWEKKFNTVTDLLNNLKTERKDFKEFDLYDKGYRVALDYIIQDLEKALRGESV